MKNNFWIKTPISELTYKEWEMLCDRCGKCCLHKLEDYETNEIFYTDIACKFLNLESCNCTDYKNRNIKVPNCISLNMDNIKDFIKWLPNTCAYKLRYNNEPLYEWHYLVSNNRELVHTENESVRNFAELENKQDLEEHILFFEP